MVRRDPNVRPTTDEIHDMTQATRSDIVRPVIRASYETKPPPRGDDIRVVIRARQRGAVWRRGGQGPGEVILN